EPPGQTNRPVHVVFSPNAQQVASGGMDGTILAWDLATGVPISRIHRGGWVRSCAFSADGRTLISCWTGDKLIISETATGRELHALKLEDPGRPDTRQSGLHMYLSDDQKTRVVVSAYQAVTPGARVNWELLITAWDTSTRKQLFRRKHEYFDFGIAVSPV